MISSADLIIHQAHPLCVRGSVIEAKLTGVQIGEICHVLNSIEDHTLIARAQVMVIDRDVTLLSLIGSAQGLSRNVVIRPTGKRFNITLSEDLRGSVVLPDGSVTERFHSTSGWAKSYTRAVDLRPPAYHERRGISDVLVTGVRAIDGLITCGVGQRMGIFSSAGCGKTTLMQMLINNASADLFVVALIGERGREVTEFIEEMRLSPSNKNCIVVYASSDFTALDRVNAANVAMTIAEYFRDLGENVVLFFDSVTRYARALRDVALSSGQLPARRGFPASVFEQLPTLLERPGRTEKGSITAFFTVLVEDEDESDPVAEEVRSIIDGHIYLTRKLASQNIYPAIDVLSSVSRVASRVMDEDHQRSASRFRSLLARQEELQTLIAFGEYKPGENPKNDELNALREPIHGFLCQSVGERISIDETLSRMQVIAERA